ncbi:MAG TPA: hypothetical protein VK192_14915 [Sphingomicrobium sp.]|nr:hypothetical protein [Sphingomicrobium sp.]
MTIDYYRTVHLGLVVDARTTNKGMKMKINSNDFRVLAGKKVDLKKWPTLVKPAYKSNKKYHKLLEAQVEELRSLQQLHYASNRYAMLLIFRGIYAAGSSGVEKPSG